MLILYTAFEKYFLKEAFFRNLCGTDNLELDMSAEERTLTPEEAAHEREVKATMKVATKFAKRVGYVLAAAAFVGGYEIYLAALIASGERGAALAILIFPGVIAGLIGHAAFSYFQYKEAMFDLQNLTRND